MVDTIHVIADWSDFFLQKKKKEHQKLPLHQFSRFFNFANLGLTDMGTFSLFVPINFKIKFRKGICPLTYGNFFLKKCFEG